MGFSKTNYRQTQAILGAQMWLGSGKILGDIYYNRISGIYGSCNDKGKKLTDAAAIPIGLKQEITKGPAQILCTVSGETRYYDVEITDLHLDHDNINRGIEMTVTENNGTYTVTLENNSDFISYMNVLKAKDAAGNLVVPAYWSDNFFSLLPGQIKTVECRCDVRNVQISL